MSSWYCGSSTRPDEEGIKTTSRPPGRGPGRSSTRPDEEGIKTHQEEDRGAMGEAAPDLMKKGLRHIVMPLTWMVPKQHQT